MIYFDNAATSFPKPQIVYDKMMEAMKEYGANPGRSGHKLALSASRGIFKTRETLAEFFNISDALDLIFTFNCTEALNLGIKGFLDPGDHVISTSMEHNSVLRPLAALRNMNIETSIVQADSEGKINPEHVSMLIRPETKLIISTHISNLTGTIMPIAEIAQIANEKGIRFMVDAAQSAGVYPIDVKKLGIDLLAFPGHKSLLGPQGTGGLYISEDMDLKEIFQGGTGSISHSLMQPEVLPDKYESGTPNAPGLIALGEGVNWINETGMDKIRAKEEDLAFAFMEGISKIDRVKIYGPQRRGEHAPVVCMNIGDADSSEVAYVLDDKYDIAVRPGLHCAPLAHKTIGTFKQGAVRFSFGYENSFEEVEAAIKAVSEIAKDI